MHKTPCHVIAGPLGVGKTTAILDFLKQQPPSERVGVLVNDFGPIGLDRARLGAEAPTTEIINLRGGCICCTLLAGLAENICKLVDEKKLDRLIIEPSGMASPAQVIEVLNQADVQRRITLRPTIVLFSAAEFDAPMFERMPFYQMLCGVADVLAFNRCDQVDEAKHAQIKAWADELEPPKQQVVFTSHGQLPQELFDHSADQQAAASASFDDHVHQFDTAAKPGGVVLEPERMFDHATLMDNIQRLCDQTVDGNQVLRFKGIVRTNIGWRSIDIAQGSVSDQPSTYETDTRLEWVTRPGKVEPEQMLAQIGHADTSTQLTTPGPTA